jgi:hypothetical protein
MPTKVGKITGWGRRGPKFVEAFLEAGQKVELSTEALAAVTAHDPSESLVFVERRGRLFHYVQWVGTCEEAVKAIDEGVLRQDEIPFGAYAMGRAIEQQKAKIASDLRDRYEWAMTRLRHEALPSSSAIRIDGLGRFIALTLRLTDQQLEEVGRRFSSALGGEWYFSHAALSREAIHVGFIVRWVRWPNPIGEHENLEFRKNMHPAALAVESGAAALVEPTLTEPQRSLLYSALEPFIPRSQLEAGTVDVPYAVSMAPVEGRPNAGVGMASDIPRDYRFLPELLRRGGKFVESTFVTAGDEPTTATAKVNLYRSGEGWAAVCLEFQLIAEGPSRDWAVAEIASMLAESIRQRLAEGRVVLSWYRPDGTSVVQEMLAAEQRRRSVRLTVAVAFLVLAAVVALLSTGAVRL